MLEYRWYCWVNCYIKLKQLAVCMTQGHWQLSWRELSIFLCSCCMTNFLCLGFTVDLWVYHFTESCLSLARITVCFATGWPPSSKGHDPTLPCQQTWIHSQQHWCSCMFISTKSKGNVSYKLANAWPFVVVFCFNRATLCEVNILITLSGLFHLTAVRYNTV